MSGLNSDAHNVLVCLCEILAAILLSNHLKYKALTKKVVLFLCNSTYFQYLCTVQRNEGLAKAPHFYLSDGGGSWRDMNRGGNQTIL